MSQEPIPAEEYERILLEKLNDPNENLQNVRLDLMAFYRSSRRAADAMFYAEQFISNASSEREKAIGYYVVGQAMEHIEDFESALRYYLLGFELPRVSVFYDYFLRNNIGFSLNQLKRFKEAETYLTEAIWIDPTRSNAFKNLGLSFEGQERFDDAAHAYISATMVDADDGRALHHLEEMLEKHEELFATIPDLRPRFRRCQELVALRKSANN